MNSETVRPFRFGVQLTNASSGDELVSTAQRIESLGYDYASLPDHFGNQLAPIPALMAIAAATTTLRVGALVLDNDFRHPVVLAKELATIDLLSRGRLEIGLGAGWMRNDYDVSGIAYDPPGVRIDRLVESLAVLRGLFAEGPFSFTGDHYTVTEYDATPLPVQRPHPPIMIGGGGRRMLSIAAREADIVGINATLTAGTIDTDAIATMSADAVEQKVAIVREAAGDRLTDIELSIRAFFVNVTDDREQALATVAQMIGVDETMIAESPFALVGSPPQIADDLRSRRRRWGFRSVVVGADDIDAFAPVVRELSGT